MEPPNWQFFCASPLNQRHRVLSLKHTRDPSGHAQQNRSPSVAPRGAAGQGARQGAHLRSKTHANDADWRGTKKHTADYDFQWVPARNLWEIMEVIDVHQPLFKGCPILRMRSRLFAACQRSKKSSFCISLKNPQGPLREPMIIRIRQSCGL